ncbi:TPA: hypothetical protein ACOTG0_002900 [Clostridium perfringens]
MPIPFIIAGLAAGALGIGGHLSAKETNEKAQRIAEDAQAMYEEAKLSLESAQSDTESALLALGYNKKNTLETSINLFLQAYEKIKNIELSESVGLNEISNFTIDRKATLQLREMSNIYESTFSSGATGAATGAVIALAASGSLPIVTGVLSTAGTAFAAGEIGVAAGLAGSALSFGAAMTPLAAIAAPVLLFSGISSSIKADENLEKANTMYAEAEVAVEKMNTSKLLCESISNKAEMFNDLLTKLNGMFFECTQLLDGLVRKKSGLLRNKTVNAEDFTEDELKLVAVTRALAGAVKSIIDTPILNEGGNLSSDSEEVYNNTLRKLPVFNERVEEVKSLKYSVKIKAPKQEKIVNNINVSKVESSDLLDNVRNILALIIAYFVANWMDKSASITAIVFSAVALLIMNNDTKSKVFKVIKNLICFIMGVGFTILFYSNCDSLMHIKHFYIGSIAVIIICSLVVTWADDNTKESNNIKKILTRASMSIFLFVIALLLFRILTFWIGFSFKTSRIITVILYFFFALAGAFYYEIEKN